MRIVVVEDAPELILLTRILLEREASFIVTTVGANFEQAEENLDWENVDCAVVDRLLGTAYEGTDLLRWLQNNHPNVRRIMLTADYDMTKENAYAEVVLRKPVSATELIGAVRGNNG